jgi:hypothetical protein
MLNPVGYGVGVPDAVIGLILLSRLIRSLQVSLEQSSKPRIGRF